MASNESGALDAAAAGTAPAACLVASRSGAEDIRQQEENRLEALTISGMEDVAAHVKAHIKWLDAEITRLEKEIDDHINRHPRLKHDAELISSIPGIGATTVARILGHLGDIRRFESALHAKPSGTPSQPDPQAICRAITGNRDGQEGRHLRRHAQTDSFDLWGNPHWQAFRRKLLIERACTSRRYLTPAFAGYLQHPGASKHCDD